MRHRSGFHIAALLAVSALISGCSTSAFDMASGGVGRFLCGENFGGDSERDARALCLGVAVAVVAELSADRVSRYRPDEAEAAFGALVNLKGTLDRVRSQASEDWFFAELFDAERLIALEAERATRRGIAAILIPGIDEVSVRASVGLAGKFSAMRGDVLHLVGLVQSGDRSLDDAWSSVLARVEYNAVRVEAALNSK